MWGVSHKTRESRGQGTVPSSVISTSLSSESKTFASGRWRGTVRCRSVGGGCGVGSSSLSLESEGDWRSGMSSSVPAPSLRLVLRCCWVDMALVLTGMVEAGRCCGMVVADDDRPDHVLPSPVIR